MRMRVLMTGCVAAFVTLGTLASPAAHADDADFVRDVQAMGFYNASDNLISQAESACYFLIRRRSPDEVEARIARYTRVDPPSRAHPFLVLAVRTYCPQFADLVGP